MLYQQVSKNNNDRKEIKHASVLIKITYIGSKSTLNYLANTNTKQNILKYRSVYNQ